MKVLILAGGYGSRLGNITEAIPKPMVKIGSHPILWHIMKIYAYYGHADFVLSLGYKADVIKQYFYNYSAVANDFTINLGTKQMAIHSRHDEGEWNVTLVDTGVDTLKGARIKRVERFLDDVNLMTYGDGVADVDINTLLAFHKGHGKAITITGVHPPARFGEVIEREGRVSSFQEKPQTSNGLINGGFMVFDRRLLERLSVDEKCDLEFGCFESLAQEGEIMVYKHDGRWECVDTERDLAHLNFLWNKGEAFWKVWS